MAAIVVNVLVNTRFNAVSDAFPFLGAAVWGAILLIVLVGGLAAMGTMLAGKWGQIVLSALFVSPVVIPSVVLGVAMAYAFGRVGLRQVVDAAQQGQRHHEGQAEGKGAVGGVALHGGGLRLRWKKFGRNV